MPNGTEQQPSISKSTRDWRPRPKVTAFALAAQAWVVFQTGLTEFGDVTVSPGLSAQTAVLIGLLVAYFTPEA